MQLSQSALFRLSCASFFAGILLSLFCDLLYALRLFLVPSGSRYTVPSIQKLHHKRIKKGTEKKARSLRIAIFAGDIILCLAGAITLILLLYGFNNGAFRAAAPLCMTVSFFLCHKSFSVCVRMALEWVAFGVETALHILALPIRRLLAWIVSIYKKNAQKRHRQQLARARQSYTKQELQNIDRAVIALLPITAKSKNIAKGDRRAKSRSKKAV